MTAEAKAVDAEGYPCTEETKGLLFPPVVRIRRFVAIGKETNELESRVSGLMDTLEATNVYKEPGDVERQLLLEAMNNLDVERLRNETVRLAERYDAPAGTKPVARSTIRDILKGRTRGTPRHWVIFEEAASRAMRAWLRDNQLVPERASLDALVEQFLAAWEDLVERPSQRYGQAVHRVERASGHDVEPSLVRCHRQRG